MMENFRNNLLNSISQKCYFSQIVSFTKLNLTSVQCSHQSDVLSLFIRLYQQQCQSLVVGSCCPSTAMNVALCETQAKINIKLL